MPRLLFVSIITKYIVQNIVFFGSTLRLFDHIINASIFSKSKQTFINKASSNHLIIKYVELVKLHFLTNYNIKFP